MMLMIIIILEYKDGYDSGDGLNVKRWCRCQVVMTEVVMVVMAVI